MKEIKIRNGYEYIRTHPQMFFGKDEVTGFDLLSAIMTNASKITGFKCVIYDDDLFVIHSHTDWIVEHYNSIDKFLTTTDSHTFDKNSPDFYHYGVLVYVFSTNIATINSEYLINHKGHLAIERIETFMKKHHLAEEGFYFIFSV